MISTHNQFYGLNNKLKQILDYLQYGRENPILIQGPMGVGKSRLLQAIRDSLIEINLRKKENTHYQFFDVNRNSFQNRHQFASEIWYGLLRSAQNKYGELPEELNQFEFGNESTDQAFLGYLDKLKKYYLEDNFVVIIDDFHHIFDSNEIHASAYRGIVSLMMAIKTYCSSQTDHFLIRFILVMQWRVVYLDSVGLKPTYVRVGPLGKDDFELMCVEWDKNDVLTKEDRSWLFHYTKGIPYFATLILDTLPTSDIQSSLSKSVKSSIGMLSGSTEIEAWFKSLREDEQYVLRWIVASKGSVKVDSLKGLNKARLGAFFNLKSMGYIGQKSEDYSIDIPCVNDFLNNWEEFQFTLEEFQPSRLPQEEKLVSEKGIVINELSQRVYIDGKLLTDIPNKEYRALVCLAKKPNQYVNTNNELIPYVYELKDTLEYDDIFYDGAIKQVVARLRKMMGNSRKYIKTRSGFGYGIFDANVELISDK